MAVMSRSQKPGRTVPVDERFRVVLAVLQGEMSVAEQGLGKVPECRVTGL
jgi:hypothetical protein